MSQKGETVAGRYRLLEKLGAGALGEVWAARDDHTERELALKLLRPKWSVAAKSLESFFRENKAAGKIRHASIMELLDCGETEEGGGKVPFVAMELLEAEKLEELLERVDTLPVGTALRLASELAWALVAAHEKNIVHERIEPANILLHRDVRGDIVPKLVDFGVSRLIEDLEITPGTPHEALSPIQYLSPEQIHADVELDGRADVYGLAALIHRCLVGSPPFDGPTVDELLEQIEEGPKKLVPFEPPIDNKVIQLISDCLQRNRKLRPTMRVFAERVDALLERIDPQWKAFGKLVRIPDERTIEHIQKLRAAKVLARLNLVKQAATTPIITAREEHAPVTPRSDPRTEDEPAPVSAIPISGSALEEAPPSLEPPKPKTTPPPLPMGGMEDAPPISQIIQEKMRTTKSNALALDVLADLEKELLKHVARQNDTSAEANVPKLDDIFKTRPSLSPDQNALLDTPAPSSRRGSEKPAEANDASEKKDEPKQRVHTTERAIKLPSTPPKAAAASEPAPPQRSNAALILVALVAIVAVVYFVMPKGNAQETPAPAASSPAASTPPPPAPVPNPVEIPTVTAPPTVSAAPSTSVAPVASSAAPVASTAAPVASTAAPISTTAKPVVPGPLPKPTTDPVATKPTASATTAPTPAPTATKPPDPTYGVDNAGF